MTTFFIRLVIAVLYLLLAVWVLAAASGVWAGAVALGDPGRNPWPARLLVGQSIFLLLATPWVARAMRRMHTNLMRRRVPVQGLGVELRDERPQGNRT